MKKQDIEDAFNNLDQVEMAISYLESARDYLKSAGAPRALDKVRSALRSAQGAQRHAQSKLDAIRFAPSREPIL